MLPAELGERILAAFVLFFASFARSSRNRRTFSTSRTSFACSGESHSLPPENHFSSAPGFFA